MTPCAELDLSPRLAPATRRTPWGLAAAALITAAWLSGCATPAPESQEPRTASDLSETDRRAKLRLELAAAYFGRGQAETALDEVKQALAARPDLPEAYNLRGLIYAALARPALAEESFKRALQLRPGDGPTLNNLALLLCNQGRYAEARVQFDAVLALPRYPDLARSQMARGVCEALDGQLEAAEVALMRSVELDPANPAAAYHLANVLFRRGEHERARFYIRRVNAQEAAVNAQSLWLAVRIEHRLGNRIGANGLGVQLRERYPKSSQALKFEQGRFDD